MFRKKTKIPLKEYGFRLFFAGNEIKNDNCLYQYTVDNDSNLKEESAKLFLKIKKDLIDKGEKSPTISLIESQIKLEDSYKQISESIRCQRQKIAEDEKNRDYLSGLYWAAQAKLNLLVNLAKNISL